MGAPPGPPPANRARRRRHLLEELRVQACLLLGHVGLRVLPLRGEHQRANLGVCGWSGGASRAEGCEWGLRNVIWRTGPGQSQTPGDGWGSGCGQNAPDQLNLATKKRKHRGERFPLARAAWGVGRRVREDLESRLPHLARLDRRGRAPVASADHGDRGSAAGATMSKFHDQARRTRSSTLYCTPYTIVELYCRALSISSY